VLPTAGGTMTGPLMLNAAPTVGAQAATKLYVDAQVATAVAKSGGTLTGALTLAGDPTLALQAATKVYVDGQIGTTVAKSGGTLSGALTLAGDPATALQAATKQYVDTRVFRNGDTLTGPLTLAADPTLGLHAATKEYVDAQASASLSKTGGTLTGALTLSADPIVALQASTKQYVDTRIFRNGDTLTGPLVLAADPLVPLQAATKEYVDAQAAAALPKAGGAITGPLTLSGDPTTALGAATKQYTDARVLRSGDTLTGALTLAADPATPLQASTKQYVDAQVATALSKNGGALTGSLLLAADPSAPTQAATKHYVDTQISGALPLSGGTLTGALALAGTPSVAAQAANKQYVDTQVATALPLTGGTLTGALTLAADPTTTMGAATKHYVDTTAVGTGVINIKAAPYNAKLDGVTDDTAAFKAAYVAAPAGSTIYVPFGVTVIQNPTSWGIDITKPVKWIVDGTTLANGTTIASAIPTGGAPTSICLPGFVVGNTAYGSEISKSSSQPTDFAVAHSSYIVSHNGGNSGTVLSNSRADTIIYNSPNDYVWGGIDRLIWAGIQTPSATTAAQHVARYIQTIRETLGTDSAGHALPQPQLWAACLEMRDVTGQSSSKTGACLTVEMDLVANGPDDGNCRQIQSLVVAQANTSGAPVEVGTIIRCVSRRRFDRQCENGLRVEHSVQQRGFGH